MSQKEELYPGLSYPGFELSAYAISLEIFFIALKTGKIIQFVPDDPQAFVTWLYKHRIRDINGKE